MTEKHEKATPAEAMRRSMEIAANHSSGANRVVPGAGMANREDGMRIASGDVSKYDLELAVEQMASSVTKGAWDRIVKAHPKLKGLLVTQQGAK